MKGCKVLVVDDESDFLDGIQYLLREEGYEVTAAGSGLDALAKLEKLTPDLILLDLMMAPPNGLKVLEAIAKDKKLKDTKVVLMSASAEPKLENPRWCGFVAKPFDIVDLLGTLSQAV